MDDSVHIIEVGQTLEHSICNLANDLDINRPVLLVNAVQGPLVHVLHADADMRVCNERPVEGHDVWRVAVMHDLQFTEDLLPNCRFRVY